MSHRRRRVERGSALLYALVFIAVIAAVSSAVLGYSMTASKASRSHVQRGALRGIAECGMMQAVHDVWDVYLSSALSSPTKAAGAGGTAAIYAKWLNGKGLLASATGAAAVTTYAPAAWSSQTSFGNKLNVTLCSWSVASGTTPKQVFLQINATAQTASTANGGDSVTLSGLYVVGAAPWPGLQFALLTNSVTCIVCHAHIDNAARVFNHNSANKGTFPGARVASLENLMVRTTYSGGDDTTIAGTLFANGNVFSSETGANVPPGNTGSALSSAGTGVTFYQIDPTSGNIVEGWSGSSGTLTPVSPYAQDAMASSPVQPNQNLYLNYPTSNQPDGPVPQSFPPAIADVNGTGSKLVSNADWTSAVQNATGTLTAYNPLVVNYGSSTSATTLPTPGGSATTFGSSSGTSTEASVVLVGTASNPITINGTVAFGGDVILQGVIQGTGELLVRGNLYVVGDVTYNDGTSGGNRTFGVQSNGNQNAIAYAAGGNVIMGNWIDDYSGNPYSTSGATTPGTPASPGAHNTASNSNIQLSFAEAATFNREQWARTQKYLPTTRPSGKTGGNWNPLPAPNATPGPSANVYGVSGVTGGPGTGPGQYAWAVNPNYDPNYVPRFYVQSDGNVYIAADVLPAQAAANSAQANGTASGSIAQAAGKQGNTGYVYDPVSGGWQSFNGSGPYGIDGADIPPPAWTSILNPAYVTGASNLDSFATGLPAVPPAVLSIGPGTYGGTQWISEATLGSLTNNTLSARPNGKALEIDGLVYTNNAIFCMAKTNDTTRGKLVVNGSLIAADTGILAAGQFNLNYDVNTKSYINVADPTNVSLTVAVFQER